MYILIYVGILQALLATQTGVLVYLAFFVILIRYFFKTKTYYVQLHTQNYSFNSGKNLLPTITDTEKSTLNISRTHRKVF